MIICINRLDSVLMYVPCIYLEYNKLAGCTIGLKKKFKKSSFLDVRNIIEMNAKRFCKMMLPSVVPYHIITSSGMIPLRIALMSDIKLSIDIFN